MNLLALIDTEGYGMRDKIHCVKEKGRCQAGLALIDDMSKMTEMAKQYEDEHCIAITIIMGNYELSQILID